MAIVREFGKPDLLVTMTCNPKWPQILNNIAPGQTATDRPDVVSRVWQQKLQALLNDLDEGVLRIQVAQIYVIEFQKRGLPHAHILIILHEDDKPRSAADINHLVSAELPGPDTNPLLYETIISSMIHGPCGKDNPRCSCMKDSKCSKKFPKRFAEETRMGNDGHPAYMRRGRPAGRLKNGEMEWDNKNINQWIVPYNPYLSQKYNCHLNVEVCSTIKAIKYIYKYVRKGGDKTTLAIDERRGAGDPNEIKRYLQARYISPIEACQRLFGYPVQAKTYSVVYLTVHLEGESSITFDAGTNLHERMIRGEESTLIAFSDLCVADPDFAGNMLYQDIPKKFRWNKEDRCWMRYTKFVPSIGRTVHCSPQQGERFHLRLMLCYRKGPTSFLDLRTVNGILYPTYKTAAKASGYLENNNERNLCMKEASSFQMPNQLRVLFVTILVYSLPSDVGALWNNFHHEMSKDFQHQCRTEADDLLVQLETLKSIETLPQANGKTLRDFSDLPQIENFHLEVMDQLIANWVVDNERSAYPRDMLERILSAAQDRSMNSGQQTVFDRVIDAVNNPNPERKLFFIGRPGGTGKSFLLEQLLATLRFQNKIAIAAASSGIAALLLMGGRTAHSTFKIPLQVTKESTCAISKQSSTAELIRQASLIIWDEAPMMHRHAFEAVNTTFQDLLNCGEPFGGKVMVLSGDFRQILPVVKRGGIFETIDACLKKPDLWQSFMTLPLMDNMRVRTASNQRGGADITAFSTFLLDVGEGRHEKCPLLGPGFIKLLLDLLINDPVEPEPELPPRFQLLSDDEEDGEAEEEGNEGQSDLAKLVEAIYSGVNSHISNDGYFAERAILTLTNADVHLINDEVTKRLSGDAREYLSLDEVQDGVEANNLYEREFLNSLSIPRILPHKLILKVGAPIMLMRNLNSDLGLCNGTRLRVVELRDNCIRATIMTGSRIEQHVFIPRIVLISSDTDYPFQLRRKQFPVVPAFAMTINKAQGQSLHNMGLYLPRPVFSHGQLYAALSRPLVMGLPITWVLGSGECGFSPTRVLPPLPNPPTTYSR